MKSEFSEFSYGFAFTYGLVNDLPGVESAPTLPSLVAEGQQGYDVELDYPGLVLFFQYKLSDILRRTNAKYWSMYRRPYFRIEVMARPKSKQHSLLKTLSDSGEPDVYYAAPLFATVAEFNQAYLANRVTHLSNWINLSQLPEVHDDEPHYITFTDSATYRWHTTEGEVLEGDFSGEHATARLRSLFERQELRQINRDYLRGLRQKVINALDEQHVPRPGNLAVDAPFDAEALRDIQYLLVTHFNVQLMILRAARR